MKTDEIIAMARKKGVVRASDLSTVGASRTLLPYLARKNVLRRISPGAYVLADHISERGAFVEIAAAIPHGVVCLLSALQYHEITTQMPFDTWVAIERGRHVPRSTKIPIHIVKLSGPAFSEGIEEQEADGVTIRVYSVAKTVIDCFKFRNLIGLDVAREALTDSLAQGKATRDEIWHYAKLCRMANIMKPYLEMAQGFLRHPYYPHTHGARRRPDCPCDPRHLCATEDDPASGNACGIYSRVHGR